MNLRAEYEAWLERSRLQDRPDRYALWLRQEYDDALRDKHLAGTYTLYKKIELRVQAILQEMMVEV